MSLDLVVDRYYQVTFSGEFAPLGYQQADPESGVFRLVRIMSYDETLETSTDMVQALYNRLGKSSSTLSEDLAATYLNQTFYVFELGDNPTFRLCVPEGIIVGHPVTGIVEYGRWMVTIDLGVWDDPTTLNAVVTAVKAVLNPTYGITFDPANNDVQVLKYRKTWLPAAGFATIQASRVAAKQATVNLKTQNDLLTAQLVQMTSERNAALEALGKLASNPT